MGELGRSAADEASGSHAQMDAEQLVIYFNNCHNRDHAAMFGRGAFFDLGTTGRQGAQALDLEPGQLCVAAEWSPDRRIVFDWYSFSYEALLTDEHGELDRVFFGRLFASETMAKEAAASSGRYGPLFSSIGHLKTGSVFRKTIAPELVPSPAGAGFGDPAENKLVETAAVRAVAKHYDGHGWSVRSVERDKCGFDMECTKGGAVEHVEVKGVRGTGLCFVITSGEVKQALENPKFFLVVVTSALTSSPTLTKFSGAEFGQRFDLSAIQYRAALKQ